MANGWDVMGKGMIHIQDSTEQDDTRFHHTTQMVHTLGQEEPLEKGMGTPAFCLENSIDGGAW